MSNELQDLIRSLKSNSMEQHAAAAAQLRKMGPRAEAAVSFAKIPSALKALTLAATAGSLLNHD
jgi:hypothetical protein